MKQEIITYIIIAGAIAFVILRLLYSFDVIKNNNKQNCSSCSSKCNIRQANINKRKKTK